MGSGPGKDASEIRRQAQDAIDRARKEMEETRRASAANEAGESELVEGSVEVVAIPPVTSALRAKLEESLQGIADLRLVTAGGSIDGGIRMIAFASRPLPLAATLGRLPFVAQVTTKHVKNATQLQVKLTAPG